MLILIFYVTDVTLELIEKFLVNYKINKNFKMYIIKP